jgi:transposase
VCKRNHIKVVEVDEFNTSKLCCKCSKVLRNYDAEKKEATRYVNAKESKFSKLKYCDECEHVIHRDINASLNIGRIYDYKLKHDKLPTIFDKNNDQFGSKE